MKKRFLKWKAYWFATKKIVHSTYLSPGEFVEYIQGKNGTQWVRIALTNKQKIKRHNPVTDVPFSEVTRVDVIPCRFIRQLYKKLGWKIKYRQLNIVK